MYSEEKEERRAINAGKKRTSFPHTVYTLKHTEEEEGEEDYNSFFVLSAIRGSKKKKSDSAAV